VHRAPVLLRHPHGRFARVGNQDRLMRVGGLVDQPVQDGTSLADGEDGHLLRFFDPVN